MGFLVLQILSLLLSLVSANSNPPETFQLILDKVFEIIGPDHLEACTLVGITIHSKGLHFWSLIEQRFNAGHRHPQILLNFRSSSYQKNLTKFRPMESKLSAACSIVFHFQEQEAWKNLDQNFVSSVPGGVFGSYHIAFTEHPTRGYFKPDMPLPLTQMHHFLLVSSQEIGPSPQTFEILTPNVWFNGSVSLASFQNGYWYAEAIDLFRSKWWDYGGGPLIVATTPQISPADLDNFFETGIQKKYIIGSSYELTRYLNTTPRILTVFPGNYGRKDPKTGTWVGLIAEVAKGKAHFTAPLAISRERTEIVSYTKIYAFDQVIFLTGLPVQVSPGGSLTFIFAPFTGLVWLGAVTSLGLICGSLMLKKRLEREIAASNVLKEGTAASSKLASGIAPSKTLKAGKVDSDTLIGEFAALNEKRIEASNALRREIEASNTMKRGIMSPFGSLETRLAASKGLEEGFATSKALKAGIPASKAFETRTAALKHDRSIYSNYLSFSILNTLLRPIVEQSADTPNLIRRVLKDSLSRFLFGSWLLALITLNAGYKSKVISVLLSPQMVSPPKTFQDLIASKYRIGAVLYNESFYGESFRHLNNEIGRGIVSRAKGYSDIRSPECYVLSERTEHVCIGMLEFTRNIANLFMTDSNGQVLYKVSTDALFPFGVGTAVSADFPHLLEPFNRLLDRLESQGIPRYWLWKEQDLNRVKGRRLSGKFRKRSENKERTSSGQEISQLLVILMAGQALALFVFCTELIVHAFQRRYK